MPRGRQPGRIYPDIIVRRLETTLARLKEDQAQIERYNKQCSKYELKPLPTKKLAKLHTATKNASEVKDAMAALA